MEVFEWKYNSKTIFGRSWNIKEGNNNIYSLFSDQFKTFLNYKVKVTNGCNKAHNTQYGVKIMEIIKSDICGMEAHLQGTWAIMK